MTQQRTAPLPPPLPLEILHLHGYLGVDVDAGILSLLQARVQGGGRYSWELYWQNLLWVLSKEEAVPQTDPSAAS